MIQRTNTTQLTRELIGVGSVSGSEAEIAEFIREYLEGHGFAPRLVAGRFSEKDWINVVCESGARNSRRIALNAHIDTVPAGDGWETNPLEAVERGGKMYGRGAADMKAGLAAQLNAFVELGDTHDLILTAVSDEEGISRGTNALADQGIYNGCSAAIFSEPNTSARNESEYEIRIGGRGRYVFEIHVRTAGGHGAKERRVNAIVEASRFLREVYEFETAEHPIMGRARYNVESIAAGAGGFLSTPSHCVVYVSRFAFVGENLESCRRELDGIVRERVRDADVNVVVQQRETPFCQPYLNDVNSRIVQCAQSAYSDIGIDPRLTAPSVYDISIVGGRLGIPSINIGPIGGDIHAPNEFVYANSIGNFERVLRGTIRRYQGE